MEKGFKIRVLTAFVAEDTDGTEGVMAFSKYGDPLLPLICADEERIKIMYPMAESISKAFGKPYKVLQFSVRTDVTEEVKEKYK